MSANNAIRSLGVLLAALLLVLLSAQPSQQARGAPAAPAEPQGQSFSVSENDRLTATGVHPADILGPSGNPLIPCLNLGLLCIDETSGALDKINALSYGWDFVSMGLPAVQFSVNAGSQGAVGTAVRLEATCSPAEPQADIFGSSADGANTQDYDGNGVACGSNSGYALGLTEGIIPSDNLNNLDRDPCLFVDMNCDGFPEEPIFFTLAPGSPTLTMILATPADILVAAGGNTPVVWASAATLGLTNGDAIDALCVRDNGNDVYDGDDEVLFSLSPGSPTLIARSASAADLFRPGPPTVFYSASKLGLQAADDVDALLCSFNASRINLPLIRR